MSQSTSRASRLDEALRDLLSSVPELEAAAVVSFDGLAMASMLPAGMDEDRVAAMSAALLSLGEKAALGLGRGDLSQVYVEGNEGTVFLVSADDEAVLVAVAARAAKAGLVLFEARRVARDIGALLATDVVEPAVTVPEPVPSAELAEAAEPVAPQSEEPHRHNGSSSPVMIPTAPEWGASVLPTSEPGTPNESVSPPEPERAPANGVWSAYQSATDWS